MSQRLQELLRQRALLQDHLAWLDRQIASEKAPPPPLPAQPATTETPLPPIPANPTAESILADYQHDASSLQNDTRRGCLMLAATGFLIFLLLTGLAYWLYSKHIGRWW